MKSTVILYLLLTHGDLITRFAILRSIVMSLLITSCNLIQLSRVLISHGPGAREVKGR